MVFRLNELIKTAEKELADELQQGLEIARKIQEELDKEPLDTISFLLFLVKGANSYERPGLDRALFRM